MWRAAQMDCALLWASVERYCATSDSWSAVSAMGEARRLFGAHVMRVEVDLFDSLVAKARRAQQ
jgi:hypothetical protein